MKARSENTSSDFSGSGIETKDQVYKRFGVSTMAELWILYHKNDQDLMLSGGWDYENPQLITNQIKEEVEKINPTELEEDDRIPFQDILNLWYHHGISVALGKKDPASARRFADKAETVGANREFETTGLLKLLAYNQLEEAKEYAQNMTVDRDTAEEIIRAYQLLYPNGQ